MAARKTRALVLIMSKLLAMLLEVRVVVGKVICERYLINRESSDFIATEIRV